MANSVKSQERNSWKPEKNGLRVVLIGFDAEGYRDGLGGPLVVAQVGCDWLPRLALRQLRLALRQHVTLPGRNKKTSAVPGHNGGCRRWRIRQGQSSEK
jgi:hypothetical protein